jgi:hypothetical protein
MEKDGDKRKYPGVIAGHGATTPEQIKQPMVFYAPGWQTTAPAIRTFDLNFHLRKNTASTKTHNRVKNKFLKDEFIRLK